jgi:hypothetical protein
MRHVALSIFALAVAACATAPPNTPGAGYGKNYTPVIDLQGVDGTRYAQDLEACRTYSASIDANKEMWVGLIGGALLGAAIGASISGDMRVIDAGATGGAMGGMSGTTGRAIGRQEHIIGNCMASRGYRVLDGTANLAYQQTAVPAQPAFQSLQGQPGGQAPTNAPPVTVPVTVATAPPKPTLGQDAFSAAKVARERKCSADPNLKMVAQGPGFETYSVACANADTMMIRCEFGNCRQLR